MAASAQIYIYRAMSQYGYKYTDTHLKRNDPGWLQVHMSYLSIHKVTTNNLTFTLTGNNNRLRGCLTEFISSLKQLIQYYRVYKLVQNVLQPSKKKVLFCSKNKMIGVYKLFLRK